MNYELRPITVEEFPKFARTTASVFAETVTDEKVAEWLKFTDVSRTVAVFDDDDIVGTTDSIAFDMTVPGLETVSVAGVTAVSVLPTHRRQGILSAMMRHQLQDVKQRGEPLAILLASESIIYGRYGYGLATTQATYQIDPRHAALNTQHEQPGRVRMIDKAAAATVLPEVYDRYRRLQPGELTRTADWWGRHLDDLPHRRNGMSERYYVTYSSPTGEIDGFATYRIKHNWELEFPENTLVLTQLMTTSPEARTALWRFCLAVDLVTAVRADNFPIQEPLRWMLKDPRRLRLTSASDFLWVRLVDIAAGLAGRRYAAEGHCVFEVEDTFMPENSGVYRLEGGPGGTHCRRSEEQPELSLHVADLGAVYLGGVSFTTLARANRVHEIAPGALQRADAMFVSDLPACCSTPF